MIPAEQLYIIPASAAHAWVEVYFPGYGWVEFEPTPIHPQLLYEGNETSLQITEQETSESASKKISPILVFTGILSGAILLVLLAVLSDTCCGSPKTGGGFTGCQVLSANPQHPCPGRTGSTCQYYAQRIPANGFRST